MTRNINKKEFHENVLNPFVPSRRRRVETCAAGSKDERIFFLVRVLICLLPALIFGSLSAFAAYDPDVVKVMVKSGVASISVGDMPAMKISEKGQKGRGRDAAKVIRDVLSSREPPYDVTVKKTKKIQEIYLNSRLIARAVKDDGTVNQTSQAEVVLKWKKNLVSALESLPTIEIRTDEQGWIPAPFGEVVFLPVSGRGGELSVLPQADMALPFSCAVAGPSMLKFEGLASGDSSVFLGRGLYTREYKVRVRPSAGTISDSIIIQLAGNDFSRAEILSILESNIKAAAIPAAGAELKFQLQNTPWRKLDPGESITFGVPVKLTGRELLPVVKSLVVQFKNAEAPDQNPARLAISNSPESINSAGTVLAATLSAENPLRLLFHHRNVADHTMNFTVSAFNPGPGDATFFVQSGIGGPAEQEIAAGHHAMRDFYWSKRDRKAWTISIPAGSEAVIYSSSFARRQVVSGIMDFVLVRGFVINIKTYVQDNFRSASSAPAPAPMVDNRDHGEFVYTEVMRSENYSLGGKWNYIDIGSPSNTQGVETVTRGNFGVRYIISIHLDNPTDKPGTVGIIFNPAAGLAGALLEIDGQVMEIRPIVPPNEVVLRKVRLDPGETRDLLVSIIPQSGSNYPVKLLLREGGCYHKVFGGEVREVCK